MALLRALIEPCDKAWDLLLPYVEFAYNKAPGKATSLSLVKVVCKIEQLSPLDLTERPLDQKPSTDAIAMVEEIQKIHELVRSKIEKTNVPYEAQANKHKKRKVF